MAGSKKYVYEWEDFEDGAKDAHTMAQEIVAEADELKLEELIVGCWGESWDNGVQPILDAIADNGGKFASVKHLFIGDMDFEECEVSWIEQGDYSRIWAALPGLEKLTIKGSNELVLGDIRHANLKELEIICGGLPKSVLASIGKAELPELEKLALYIGVEDYGFDGSIKDIENMLAESNFPKLKSLGIMDSEIQDEVAEVVLKCKYIDQVEILDLSMGTLTDKGGELLLAGLPAHKNLKKLELEFHYLSDEMMEKLDQLQMEVNLDDQQEAESYAGDIYYYPMLTE